MIIAPDAAVGPPPLFPHRRLPLQGKLPFCFYCGLTYHEPAACPAKMLTMQTQGLPTIGYLPLEELSEFFLEAINRREELNNTLAAGLRPAQLRQDPLLRTYVGYFDLNKIYQPRFLVGIAFSSRNNWNELGRPEAIHADSNNLFLGLDCLRVGQYRQADEIFVAEGRRPQGKALFATVGRALVSLEQHRIHDMGHYLESALKMADTDRDRTYISLLLSRYYRVLDDSWKASHALDNILSFDRQCHDAIYRQLQLAVADGFDEQVPNRLRALAAADKSLFIHILMDPELSPIQAAVEELLQAQLATQAQEAEEAAAEARVTCTEMEQWLGEGEEELERLRADLAIIEQQEAQKSYFDLIDIASKSRQLVHGCHRLQEACIDSLHERLEKTDKSLAELKRFWRDYSYQSFFPRFKENLDKVEKVVSKALRAGDKKMHGSLYRSLVNALDECEQSFTSLREMKVRMIWVRNLFNGGRQFVKSLVIAEMALISLAAVLLVTLVVLAGSTPALVSLTEVLRLPAVQKELLLLLTLVLAPLAALVHTLWRSL